MTNVTRRRILRANAIFLILFGGSGFLLDLRAYFFSTGAPEQADRERATYRDWLRRGARAGGDHRSPVVARFADACLASNRGDHARSARREQPGLLADLRRGEHIGAPLRLDRAPLAVRRAPSLGHDGCSARDGRVPGHAAHAEPADVRLTAAPGAGRALRLEAAREIHAAGLSSDAGGHHAQLDRHDGEPGRRAGAVNLPPDGR